MTWNKSPDRAECMKVLEDYGTPTHVIGHCRAVAAVGFTIGRALNMSAGVHNTSFDLDLDLIIAAGLLHDMARTEDEHWEVAADYCIKRGWKREADIIRTHMHYEFNIITEFTETDIVCLADRLVMEDRYVGLERRMEYIVAKAILHGNEHYVPIILKKKEKTAKLISEIELILGIGLDELMKDLDYEHPEN